jgi:chemotaxis signal transduction protein
MTTRGHDGGDEPRPEATNAAPAGGRDTRDLFVFSAGGQLFAVFAEEVESAAGHLRPAPLPFAPPAVLGVVPVRGRMRTALDPLRLLNAPASPDPEARPAPATTPPATAPAETPPLIFVVLAGDEQLALACDSAEGPVAVPVSRLQIPPDARAPARGRVEHDGRVITLLDPSRLFDAAMRGTDRRRRRS